jgi:hypothetical protein
MAENHNVGYADAYLSAREPHNLEFYETNVLNANPFLQPLPLDIRHIISLLEIKSASHQVRGQCCSYWSCTLGNISGSFDWFFKGFL